MESEEKLMTTCFLFFFLNKMESTVSKTLDIMWLSNHFFKKYIRIKSTIMVNKWFCLESYILFVKKNFFFLNHGNYKLDWFIHIFTMFC